jgi:hypothetical protein
MIDFNSFLLIAAAGLALIGGIIFGLYSNRIFSLPYKVKKKDGNQSQYSKVKEKENENEEEQKQTKSNLLKRNFELLEDEIKIYQFEKDLVSQAIENILLASKNKSIDVFEKDRLLLKYNDQLKKLNEKLDKIQSESDVTKLIDLRNDLASLLDNKISDIDQKIREINIKIETKSKIGETKNQNKNKNKNNNNNLNNLNNPSDIEETIDANLKTRKVISYKSNNNTNKEKETSIEAERKKIIDLKDQVLAALNRLDRAGIIKEEIKNNEVVIIPGSLTKKDLTEEENKNSLQKVYDFNDKDHKNQQVVVENRISPKISINEKVSVPKIFSSIMKFQSKNDTVIPNKAIISNPILKSTNQGIIIKNDETINKIKTDNSFINDNNQVKSNYNNDNKSNSNSSSSSSSPLSNILNYSDLKFDHFIDPKDFEKDIVKTESKDKQSLSNDKSMKFKFPLGFIFSKSNNKEKKIENRTCDTNTKRKDSLSNIVN